MTVPDYQSMMTPLLQVLADEADWRWADVKDALATATGVSEADRAELLPSGRQATFDNRAGWAATYLSQAGLIERPARGIVRITVRGRDTLASHVGAIDNAVPKQFPEFLEFKNRSRAETASSSAGADASDQTPEELIESGYQSLRSDLAQQVMERVSAVSPRFFEQLVVKLLVEMGYGGSLADAGQAVGRSVCREPA